MDNFCDEQKNMECNIREIKIRNFHWVPCKVPVVATHVYCCRHLHSSSLSLRDLALSLSRHAHLSLCLELNSNSANVSIWARNFSCTFWCIVLQIVSAWSLIKYLKIIKDINKHADGITNSTIHKAAVQPAAIQNEVWRAFCTAVPHRHFSVLQGTAGN